MVTSATTSNHRFPLQAAAIASAVAVALAAATPASAQLADEIDPALLNNWRIQSGNVIRFCVLEVNTTREFDRGLGEAIAERLLLDSEIKSLVLDFGVDGEDLELELFKALVNDCEVVMGMRVSAELYAAEFTVTRPYVAYEYAMIVRDEGIRSLSDIRGGARIGAQLGSSADVALARENATRPAAERWSRLPYGESGLMMTRLLDGTIEGMVVFGPVYASLSATRPEEAARLHMAELPPSLRISSNIGGLMLSQNAFLRSEVDRAIAEMTADGTIARLLEEHGFGDIPAIPGGL